MSQQINLFNPIFCKQKTQFSLLAILQSLAVILVSALLLYAYAAHQVSDLDVQAAQGAQRLDTALGHLAAHSAGYSPQQAGTALKNELEQLEKKTADATQLSETLKSGVLGNTSGYSEYLRAFSRQIVPGVWLTDFKVTGTQISLSGGAVTPELVPAYIRRLGREPVMQGKRFSNLQIQPPKATTDGKAYVEFTLYSTPDEEVKP